MSEATRARVEEITRLHENIHEPGLELSGGCHVCELLEMLARAGQEREHNPTPKKLLDDSTRTVVG